MELLFNPAAFTDFVLRNVKIIDFNYCAKPQVKEI